jgi:hypothetical protein
MKMSLAETDREEFLRNPKPGTACAAARDFGIDLTLVIENLRLTPEERIRQLDEFLDGIEHIKKFARILVPDEKN